MTVALGSASRCLQPPERAGRLTWDPLVGSQRTPDLGNCHPNRPLTLAGRLGQPIPEGMYESQSNSNPESMAPGKRTLLLAVLAPFGAIALLASPLLIEAARHAAGI